MKNAEEAIENVLAGLRDAAAPEGMERRVLDSLERRELAGAQSARDGWRMGWVRSCYVICCAAAVVLLVFVLWGTGRHASVRRTGAVSSAKSLGAGTTGGESKNFSGNVAAGLALHDVNARRPGRVPARMVKHVSSQESIEWSEMHAPSHPAPEMPLTEEERQLLRVVHKGDRVELAELKSSVRDERYAREKAEFQEFFGSAKNGGNE